MRLRDILAIGTSAGGIDALRSLARGFPKDFPASVLVVIHLSAHFNSSLDVILTQEGRLPAVFAKDGMPMEHGRIYIAPLGSHLLAAGDTLRLGQGPRENNARPSIDPMFRSVALCCGSRAVGAVLTGTLGDGASGLHTLHECGGITVVQDPRDAAFSGMPEAVLMKFKPHHVVSLAAMPALFGELIAQSVGVRALDERIAMTQLLQREAKANNYHRTAASWSEVLAEFEREAQALRDSMRRIDEIAARVAGET
ncbi:MAG: chemotaxis protein CheB [Bradyrhizobium sp.]|nr:chemotaxis protein CheB [Bradyrhizobium sp.]